VNLSKTITLLRARVKRFFTLLFALAVMLLAAAPAFAQTPVPIQIDTNALMNQVNAWTATLDDVVFLGVAIAIAIAILTFIGNQILKAFRNAGS
jgi:hypothetical protein